MMLPGELRLIPFQEQIETYPALKDMLLTMPKTNVPAVSPPWRVYVMKTESSGWARKDFPTYRGAFDFWKTKRKIWYDVSITSKRLAFPPPNRIVKISRGGKPVMVKSGDGTMRQETRLVPLKPPGGHLWCKYCRRFTVFTYFLTHHAFRTENLKICYDPTERRCCVCGIRERTGADKR